MISDVGKILDPVADKLTQATMLFCLLTRFPLMIAPLGLMILKELFMCITGFLVIKKQKMYMAQTCTENWQLAFFMQ